jgi:HAMP domain-containing protein
MAEQGTARKIRFISLRVKLLIGFTLLFTVVFAVAFYWFYNFASDKALARIQEDLRDTLLAAAEGVDVEQFVALYKEGVSRADGYTDDPRYWDHVNWLLTVHKIEPRADVYTYIESDRESEVIFVGSSGAVADPPWGAKFLQPYHSGGTLLRGLQETTFKNDFQPYTDEYGEWVSGYSPIENDQGELVGALGVDFRAGYVYDVQQAVRDQVGVAFAITYVTLFLLVLLISNGLTRPTIALTQIAERIGEGDYEQDLSSLSAGRSRDEIGTLAHVFSIMVDKVRQREQTLRRQVEELRIEIDETKRKEQVEKIVDSDFFRDLQAKAQRVRSRRSRLEGNPDQGSS